MNLTGQKAAPKPEAKKPDPRRLDRVRALPCCICEWYGEQQRSPTTAHHWIHGRNSSRKTPDQEAIPLCDGHHQGTFDHSKIALHSNPDDWKASYGLDSDWIERTQKALGEI